MIIGILISILLLCVNLGADEVITEIEKIYTEFRDLGTDGMEVYQIDSLDIIVDVSTLNLRDGYYYIFAPVNDQHVFCAFKGNVHFQLMSDAEDAIRQFKNATDKDYFEGDFDEVFITDTRGLIEEVRSTNEKVEDYPEFKNIDLRMNKVSISNGSDLELRDTFVGKLVQDAPKGYCRYELINDHDRIKRVCYSYNNIAEYENYLYFIPAQNKIKKSFRNNIWIDKLDNSDKFGKNSTPEENIVIEVERYNLNVEISKNMDLVCEGTVKLTIGDNLSKWIEFDIGYLDDMDLFELEYVVDSDGGALKYFHNNNDIWVKLPDSSSSNSYQVGFKYKAPYMTNTNRSSGTKSPVGYWYPNLLSEKEYHADLTFTYPKKFNIFCVGEKISEEKSGKIKKSIYRTVKPLKHIDFTLGKIKSTTLSKEGLPEITVFMDKGRSENVDMVVNFMGIMSKIIGSLDIEKLKLSESSGVDYSIPDYVVLNFPEISANIGNTVFSKQLNSMLFTYPIVKISELWWGKSVQMKNIDDNWLKFSLSEITSLVLIHKCDPAGADIYKDNISLQNDYVRRIYENAVSVGTYPDAVYDVFMNYRTKYNLNLKIDRVQGVDFYYELSNSSDYRATYVMHLLRYYLMNVQNQNDDVFLTVLRTFYSDYKGKKASTKDFIKTVNSVTGKDMNWFFDQWVYGNRLPEIEYDYSGSQENGVNYLNLEITQSGVGDNFISRIPVRVVYQNGQSSTFNVDVTGTTYKNKLKLPMEMKELEFDPFNTVILKEKK